MHNVKTAKKCSWLRFGILRFESDYRLLSLMVVVMLDRAMLARIRYAQLSRPTSLDYSASRGNDLKTPRPEFGFPGLKAWRSLVPLCALRWEEARQAGKAPKVKLASTNIKTLEIVPLEKLKIHSFDLN